MRAELLGLQDAQTLLSTLERTAPALVRDSVPKPVTLRLLTEVLRCLLAEGVSIRALAPILETLAGAAAAGANAQELAERVRARLARQITAAHVRDGVLALHLVDPLIEEALRDALPPRGDGTARSAARSSARHRRGGPPRREQRVRREHGAAHATRPAAPPAKAAQHRAAARRGAQLLRARARRAGSNAGRAIRIGAASPAARAQAAQ